MAGIVATNSNIEDNIDFQSYIDAVKQGNIAWDFFIQLMKDLSITTNRSGSSKSELSKITELRNKVNYEFKDMLLKKDFFWFGAIHKPCEQIFSHF